MEDNRPNPDALLREVEQQLAATQGKLKIFFGYAAGVGKTYAMLEAAHHAREMGVDVVMGYIEPHTRPETLNLLNGLEQLPVREIFYKGITLREFDLDAALARRPQLMLVDELAHTNAQGSRHLKRYQDIEELLRSGIDVYTTVNVQHLEGLNDVVSAITGVAVTERVPDRIFDAAAQVEVVDIEPEDLLERLRGGKIYREQQAQRAMNNFFSPKNLAALREIALRRTADRLGRTLEARDNARPETSEHILICLSSAPSNGKVIRTAARMAEAFRSGFTALFVETPDFKSQSSENRYRLRTNLRLAEEMGARIATVYGDDTALQIAEYAKASGVSKIIIGRSNHKRSLWPNGKSLVDRLTELAPNLDVYIIPNVQVAYHPQSVHAKMQIRFSWLDFGKTLLCICLASLISWVFFSMGFSEANIITVYILGVLCSSIWTGGHIYGFLASLSSVLVFNFLFTEPRFTLFAYDAGYPVTFGVMFAASLLTGSLTKRVKAQARQASLKAYRTEVLLQTSQKLQKAENKDAILEIAATQLHKLLNRTIVFYAATHDNKLDAPRVFQPPEENDKDCTAYITPEEQGVANWVHKNNKHAGATTNTLPSSKCLYLAVRGENDVLAVAGIVMATQPELDTFEKNLMLAVLDECGLVLDKLHLDEEKHRVEQTAQQEALRANLLRAISHDLRTPLTSITGNAGILMENSLVLDDAKKHELYSSIYDDSQWLISLVENLLSVTRIENGTMKIKMEPELLYDVFGEALAHLDRRAAEHHITSSLTDDLLMANMDARLIVQVVINIVNNAIKYTAPDSHIHISARKLGSMALVKIEDDGPGIPDGDSDKLFDMFFTANNVRGDGRRGLGLGLSLCKSIVVAHGGRIGVKANKPTGTVFYFTLQGAEVNADE